MRIGPTIGSLFRVCFGLKTGDDAKFLHHMKRLHLDDRPLLRGNDVKRYSYEYKGEYVWYVPQKMRAHRPTARPGEPERFEQPKVLVKDTTTDFAGTYDDEHFYVKDVLIVIPFEGTYGPFDLRYIVGIVNSHALRFYYRSTFATIHVQCEELGSLPLPSIDLKLSTDKKRRDAIVALVNVMLDLNKKLQTAKGGEKEQIQRQVEKTDREIDEIVYKLYKITDKERKIIEGE